MSKKIIFKKSYSNFNPEAHWGIVLSSFAVLFILATLYAGYLYVSVKKQIDNPVTVQATSTEEGVETTDSLDILKSVQNIDHILTEFENKESVYKETLEKLSLLQGQKNTGTTSIATTSKQ